MRRSRIDSELAITIGPHTLPVVVDHQGEFWAEWEGSSYRSRTFKGLRVLLLPKVREDAKRCEIPVVLVKWGDDIELVTLVGIHGDNGNVLYLDKEGKTHQLGRRSEKVYHPFTPAERRKYLDFNKRIRAVERARSTWLKARQLQPGKLVRQAIGLPPEKRDEPLDDDDDEL